MHLCAQLVRDLSTDNRTIESVISKYYETDETEKFGRKKKSKPNTESNPYVHGVEMNNGNEKIKENRNCQSDSDSDSDSSEETEGEEGEEEEGKGEGEEEEYDDNMDSKRYDEINEKYKNKKMNFTDFSPFPNSPIDGGIDFISQQTLDLWSLYSIVRQSGC